MYYLLIDKFKRFYVVKTNFVIKTKEQATRIARERQLIEVYNSIVIVEPISPIWYIMGLVRKGLKILTFA